MTRPVAVSPSEREWTGWEETERPRRGNVEWKTMISADLTPNNSLSAGYARIAPGEELGLHSHPQAEVYVVIAGTAHVQTDGVLQVVETGGAVFIPGGTTHGCRNHGPKELRFVYCFPESSVGDVEYRFD